jgi:hypothetical protein
MRTARTLTVLAAALVVSACGGQASTQGTGSFASYAGVLGCADVVAWGTVTGSTAVDEGLEVTFDVDEWVHPGTGSDSVTFVADDPQREVAAPAWPAAQDKVLVILSEVAPTARLDVAEGEQAVQQWRDAGSPRLSDDECGQA